MKKLATICVVVVLAICGIVQAGPNLVITTDPTVAAVANWDNPCPRYEGYLATTPELVPGVDFTAELTYEGGGYGQGGALFPWTVEDGGYELFPNWAQFAVEVASDDPPANPPLPYVTPGYHILITLNDPGLSWGTVDMGLGKLQLTTYYEEVIGTLSVYVVPEPATMCLLGLGALGLLKKRRA